MERYQFDREGARVARGCPGVSDGASPDPARPSAFFPSGQVEALLLPWHRPPLPWGLGGERGRDLFDYGVLGSWIGNVFYCCGLGFLPFRVDVGVVLETLGIFE